MSRAVPLAAVLACLAAAAPASAAPASKCNPFGKKACLMPFPNDARLTVRDTSSDTGRRVKLPVAALPANKDGKRLDPTEWNRNDGFSPGAPLLAYAPGVSISRSKLPRLSDMATYKAANSGLVVIDTATGRRHMVWAELDSTAKKAGDRLLMIHPGVLFSEGRRYVVALRNLRTSSGRRLKAPRGFAKALRSRKYASIRRTLKRAKVSQRGLYLAWDFTVMSKRSLQSRMVNIRDDAFRQLGDTNLADGRVEGRAPEFKLTDVRNVTDDPRIARRISGTFTVPCYLAADGCPPGSRFNYGSGGKDALPRQKPGNVIEAPLECEIPTSALTTPARIAMYGHGLLGGPSQIDEDNIRTMAAEHNFVFCATAWKGFSNEDVPFLIGTLGDIGQFPAVADRIQQGFLDQLYLGRLMIHPQGLASSPAFQVDGRPVIDTRELYYDGNSQGGILGAALAPMAPDYRRAVLGVPGVTFATLLTRSVDFDAYSQFLYPAYPVQADRPLVLSLIQQLWDRGEGDGWAAHTQKDLVPNTPSHTVLLQPSVGDHQVTTWQADVLARTIGASARRPAIAADRTLERSPLYGIPTIPSFPFGGSAIVYWDAGTDFTGIAPVENLPPRTGQDSHYVPRNTPEARQQKSEFLKPGGAVVDTCPAGRPCVGVDDATP